MLLRVAATAATPCLPQPPPDNLHCPPSYDCCLASPCWLASPHPLQGSGHLTQAERLARVLRRHNIRVLIVHGRSDALVPAANSRRLASLLPNTEVNRLKCCGPLVRQRCCGALACCAPTAAEQLAADQPCCLLQRAGR